MLDATIFSTNFHVMPTETFGTGMHRFDIYVLRGAVVTKYVVFGQDYKEAVQAFCFRFQLKNKGKRQFSNRGVSAYRLYLRSAVNGAKICDECIVKMVV